MGLEFDRNAGRGNLPVDPMSGRLPDPNDEWTNRPVLVTGASGFVGRWLVEALAIRGAVVHAFVRNPRKSGSESARSRASKIHEVQGSITDLAALVELVADAKIETIFHLAATSVNRGAEISPYDLYESNTRGVYTILEAARRARPAVRVVIASSRETEDCFATNSPRQLHPYMTSKAAAELVTRAYADTFGLPAAVLRLGNIYGGGDSSAIRLVPGTIQSILRGETPVIRGDGRVCRDFLYVEDAIAAFLALGSRLADPGIKGNIFRIATGINTPVQEVVKEIMRIAGLGGANPRILGESCDGRTDAPYEPVFERKSLGWQPRFTLAEGLQRTWAWYRDRAIQS
jgi:CDP-glucose 4,6-dehydratase